jgi:uncharacterized damage-inducible protein DinB
MLAGPFDGSAIARRPGRSPPVEGNHMNVGDIRTLYAYNRWATNRLLEVVRALDHADFTRVTGTSHGSLRGTFVHLVWAEWIWLQRWRGHSPKSVFDQNEFPTLETVATLWREVDRAQQEFLQALTDDRLTARISYDNLVGQRWEYPLAQMMQHVVNHSSYHRGQLVSLLRLLGCTPPSTDYLLFFDEVGR